MENQEEMQEEDDVKIIRTTSAFDCGGRCPLRFHVKDGKIIRVEGDDSADSDKQLRTCIRCRAIRQYIYHPERLRYPLKRAGPKGSGKFERISWDEAYDTITKKLKETIEKYGNQAIFNIANGGYFGALHGAAVAYARLFASIGGFTTTYGNISSQGAIFGTQASYGFGQIFVGNSREDWLNSKLIICWGWDPARQISGTNTLWWLIKAKENGTKVIVIDPRYSDTALVVADQWIPIIPGTDTAMMAAVAHVILKENLQDQEFLDKFTHGFDKYREYVMGEEDGIPKTPEWAEKICGVKASVIEDLAREYATTKPAALEDCQGPARSAMGGQYNRGAITLSAMTGNIGKPGGSACGGLHGIPIGHMFRSAMIPPGANKAYPKGKSLRGNINPRDRLGTKVHVNKVFDAILKGKSGGYPADVKFVWFSVCDFVNQLGNTNKAAEAMSREDLFTVVPELWLTPTAQYADIVLPVTGFSSRTDLTRPWPSGPYFGHMNKAIEPIGECKDDLLIAEELAERLGIKNFKRDELLELFLQNPQLAPAKPLLEKYEDVNDKWLRLLAVMSDDVRNNVKDYDKYREKGVQRVKLKEPYVAFKKNIDDIEKNPFATPSKKIEIYSDQIASWNNPLCPPIAKYIPTWENREDPLVEKYPLQMISPHPRQRVHSELYKIEWLMEAIPHRMWINPVDAESRDIRNGDMCLVFNDRGTVAIEAFVTKRIIPGVVCIYEGAWYNPDENGIDRGACANTLTKDAMSEGGAAALKTCLVQVKIEKGGA
ncbi:MAG: molybdopterin-dependent oxidoreductase [Candidatus Lokiarchaeota archaeon]|nr:molybdopterin-dependent oxidoreductase [Candidatus Lokiarchaeota archaeon]